MKMAKASEADLQMAMDLAGMLDMLGHRHCPSMPTVIARNDGDEDFDRDDDEQCGRALRALLETADRASLFRVVWGAAVMLDPRNQCVDPDADTIEHHADTRLGRDARTPRPLADWHDDRGAVLWWRFPVDEPPYCGHPNCDDWPGYHTHWTPLVVPHEPAAAPTTEAA